MFQALDANIDIPAASTYYQGMFEFSERRSSKSHVHSNTLRPPVLSCQEELTLTFYHCHIETYHNQE
ncbi:hypothetical protein SCLCIDRAFT_1218978 [Scleroderma citrinum Foug A]|uniref:Uncharacterized protein n=1 Tax=Scleroderma citrinum Foug A TaxID=1036808 RepID=A0A0C3DB17_9AGAM|nr:hypothetical protein SCLCIDRAFT_1218978 [Scleroderma citrinum Foug A]